MYTLNASRTVQQEVWNQSLRKLNGCPFHTEQWSRFSAENRGRQVIYFTLSDPTGAIVAMANGQVTMHIARKLPFRSLSFGSRPAYRDADTLNVMIRKIQSYATEQGFMSLQWNSFGSPEACSLEEVLPTNRKKRWEFVVDLEGSETDLWKRLHSKKRNMINKAGKTGLKVVQASSSAQIHCYRELALKTWQRKTEQGISFPKPPDKDHFDLIKRQLVDSGIGRMYLAMDGSETLAGAFFVGFADNAYYVLSASDNIGLKKAAPDLLVWTAMCDYQREGLRNFNLGGVSEDELHNGDLEQSGLYHFKVRFSAHVMPCFNSHIVIRPFLHHLSQQFVTVKSTLRKAMLLARGNRCRG